MESDFQTKNVDPKEYSEMFRPTIVLFPYQFKEVEGKTGEIHLFCKITNKYELSPINILVSERNESPIFSIKRKMKSLFGKELKDSQIETLFESEEDGFRQEFFAINEDYEERVESDGDLKWIKSSDLISLGVPIINKVVVQIMSNAMLNKKEQ